MAMGFHRWAGQDQRHYYSISIPFIVLIALITVLVAVSRRSIAYFLFQ